MSPQDVRHNEAIDLKEQENAVKLELKQLRALPSQALEVEIRSALK
jgi:hypothetical protein